MNITFRQLRLFLATAETGSVSAAARAMHVTQPTASMQLREVSESVGMPLYEIIGRKLYLTDAGRQLAQTARRIVGEWESFEQSIHAMQGLTEGRLRIAVVSTAKYFVPRLLGSFCAQHPNIDISLEVLNRDGVVQRLRENRDDLYVMTTPPTDIDLEDQVFLANPLCVIAPHDHALSARKRVSIHALQAERFLLREGGSGTRLATDRFFKSQNFEPSSRLELGSNEAIKEAVASHLGIAVLSAHAIKADDLVKELCVLPINGTPIPSQWHIVYPKARQLSPIASVFKHHLMQDARLWAANARNNAHPGSFNLRATIS